MDYKRKLAAFTLAVLAALTLTACCGGDKKPDPKPADNKPKPTATTEKKKDPWTERALAVMKLPEVAKYDKISKDAYPHLKWGSTGYYASPKIHQESLGALKEYNEVQANFTRTLSSDDTPKFKDEKGIERRGEDRYRVQVLVGGCKGNCVIEAVGIHTKKVDAASYKNPIIEKKVYVPFDKTYVRHDENGKKWVTHEKCGTK